MELKSKMSVISDSVKFVFRNPFYILVAAIISIALFFLFLFVINIPLFLTAIKFASVEMIPTVFANIINNIIVTSSHIALYMFASVTILAGVNISMLIFKLRVVKEMNYRSPIVSFGGVFGGALAAGCPSCSISLIALLGVAGGLSSLPLRGVEFSAIGAAALILSIYWISKSIRFCEACRIHFKK